MSLTLYLAPGTVAKASHAALETCGADYDLVWLDFKAGAQRSADYLAVNPKGRVPALATPQGILTETIAILEWIAATHPEARLMPDDPWQAARVRETMTYLGTTMHVAHAHKARGHRWSDDVAAQATMTAKVPQTMAECAALLEARIDGDWVTEAFSVADLYLWTILGWLDGDGVPLAGYPRLKALCDRVAARAAVQRVQALHP
ncbi:MAG: glutathione S-transferase family protein [Jannaschia sp.]